MKLRKIGALIVSTAVCALALAGCGGTNTPAATTAAKTEAASGTKPVILVVSFGTSYNDSRDVTIGAIENSIKDANPDKEVRRAFTSQIIIDKLKERDGLEIDNVEEAFARLEKDGVKELIVQPTHVMNGFEYDDLITEVEKNRSKFDSVKIGSPILTSDDDYTKVIDALTAATAEYDDGNTAIVFMGHGTEHAANATYAKLQSKLKDAGKKNYCIGTVEAEPSIDDVIKFAKDGGYKRVVLEPLMVVAGDQANNDMAGDEDDSWKTILEKEGFEVVPVLKGLGQIEGVRSVYVDHAANAK